MLSIAPIPEVPILPLGVWPDFEPFRAAKLKSSGDTDSFDVRLLNLHNGRTPTRIANSKGAHMSRLTEYRRLKQQITEQRSRLDELRSDPRLEKEMEFEGKLRKLLEQHGKGLADVVDLLNPNFYGVQRGKVAVPAKRTRQARRVKVYRNPLTGEIVESKGGNNWLLGAWKAQFGHEEVESWVRQS